jgi:large subunit ribosomal protein L3
MAGRMGNVRVTVPGLTVHAVDAERGLLLIKGAVPGVDGGLVFVRSAAKRPAPADFTPAEAQKAEVSA